MDPVFFVLAILGCGDDAGTCRQARVEPVRYSTVQQCQADMTAVLARNTDLDYPVVAGSCRASGPRMVRADTPAKRG